MQAPRKISCTGPHHGDTESILLSLPTSVLSHIAMCEPLPPLPEAPAPPATQGAQPAGGGTAAPVASSVHSSVGFMHPLLLGNTQTAIFLCNDHTWEFWLLQEPHHSATRLLMMPGSVLALQKARTWHATLRTGTELREHTACRSAPGITHVVSGTERATGAPLADCVPWDRPLRAGGARKRPALPAEALPDPANWLRRKAHVGILEPRADSIAGRSSHNSGGGSAQAMDEMMLNSLARLAAVASRLKPAPTTPCDFLWRGLTMSWQAVGVAAARGWVATVNALLSEAQPPPPDNPPCMGSGADAQHFLQWGTGRGCNTHMLKLLQQKHKELHPVVRMPWVYRPHPLAAGIALALDQGQATLPAMRSFLRAYEEVADEMEQTAGSSGDDRLTASHMRGCVAACAFQTGRLGPGKQLAVIDEVADAIRCGLIQPDQLRSILRSSARDLTLTRDNAERLLLLLIQFTADVPWLPVLSIRQAFLRRREVNSGALLALEMLVEKETAQRPFLTRVKTAALLMGLWQAAASLQTTRACPANGRGLSQKPAPYGLHIVCPGLSQSVQMAQVVGESLRLVSEGSSVASTAGAHQGHHLSDALLMHARHGPQRAQVIAYVLSDPGVQRVAASEGCVREGVHQFLLELAKQQDELHPEVVQQLARAAHAFLAGASRGASTTAARSLVQRGVEEALGLLSRVHRQSDWQLLGAALMILGQWELLHELQQEQQAQEQVQPTVWMRAWGSRLAAVVSSTIARARLFGIADTITRVTSTACQREVVKGDSGERCPAATPSVTAEVFAALSPKVLQEIEAGRVDTAAAASWLLQLLLDQSQPHLLTVAVQGLPTATQQLAAEGSLGTAGDGRGIAAFCAALNALKAGQLDCVRALLPALSSGQLRCFTCVEGFEAFRSALPQL